MMKAIKFLCIAVFSFLVISVSADNKKKNKKEKKTVTYEVNMDCHDCVNKIEAAIPYEKGVKGLKVSLEKKEVTVTFRSDKNTSEGIEEAIADLGYETKVKEDSNDKKETEKKKEEEDHQHNDE